MQQSKRVIIVLGIIVCAVVLVIGLRAQSTSRQEVDEEVSCTMEAQLCPDGSAVGRQGPDCAFPECPQSVNDTPIREEE